MEEKEIMEKENNTQIQTQEISKEDWEIKYIRLQAEFENFRQRLRKEKEEIQETANARLLKEIIDILDNFNMALETIKHTRKKDSIIEGINMIYRQFQYLLEKEGVVKMEVIGATFDPNFHEAVGVEEVEDGEDNIIVKEVQSGYLYKNRLLRPAKVIVSKKIEKKEVENNA